jgi:hypothetical protein
MVTDMDLAKPECRCYCGRAANLPGFNADPYFAALVA